MEKILSLLTDPVNQRRIAQVCLLWHDLVERLRYVVFTFVVFYNECITIIENSCYLRRKHWQKNVFACPMVLREGGGAEVL